MTGLELMKETLEKIAKGLVNHPITGTEMMRAALALRVIESYRTEDPEGKKLTSFEADKLREIINGVAK